MFDIDATLPGLDLSTEAADALRRWLSAPRYATEREALQALVERAAGGDAGARAELGDAFAQPLPIGTGGRRGTCGVGPNRVNQVVLRETAQGLADAMAAEGVARRVAVVFDTRRDSRTFAHMVAEQLAANGLEVLVVDAPRPTPLLSFLVRSRGCGAGIVISASHNPPPDNGIKIYGPDGAQVLGARDKTLMDAILAAMDPERVLPTEVTGNVRVLGPDEIAALDREYLDYVVAQGVCPSLPVTDGFRVVFTPLHGVGHTSVVPALRERGVQVDPVEVQCDPDGGNFSTVESANPEVPASMAMARAQAETSSAALVLATDPDADRLGCLVRDADGNYTPIDGNRLGVLMLDHLLRNADLPDDGWVLTTLVTSPLVGALCRSAGIDVVDDLLVGFKHHAGMVAEQPARTMVFGCEESHGYVRGNEIRDKDGAIGALLLSECAVQSAAQGRTLLDELDRIWGTHGYHREKQASLKAPGAAGREAIAALMQAWRGNAPSSFGGLEVRRVDDRKQARDTGSATRDLPGNVLSFELSAPGGGLACRLVLRPSGTEPKIKIYVLTRAEPGGDLAAQKDQVDRLTDAVLDDARAQAEVVMAPILAG